MYKHVYMHTVSPNAILYLVFPKLFGKQCVEGKKKVIDKKTHNLIIDYFDLVLIYNAEEHNMRKCLEHYGL